MDAHMFVNLFHILFIAPFFIWTGVAKSNFPFWGYNTLLILGIIVIIYHGYKAVIRFNKGSPMIWVSLVHALLVGPLILYIGMQKKDTPRSAYEMLLLVAFAALGYHLYELVMYYDFA